MHIDGNPFEAAEYVQTFFEESTRYELNAVHTEYPGKNLFTSYDAYKDEQVTVIWEGGESFSYEVDGHIDDLSGDENLYQAAREMMVAYPALTFDTDIRPRARTVAASKGGADELLNEPMEWGVRNDERRWKQKGWIQSLRDIF